MRGTVKVLATGIVVLAAVAAAAVRYWDYVENPWTRNGQVRAQVVQIAPRVSGPIIDLPIVDNQLVEQGELLFAIDPRTYQASLDRAKAELDQTVDELATLQKDIDAQLAVVESAKANIEQGKAAVDGYEARLVEARKERDRQVALQKEGATSTRAVERAEADFQAATEQKASATAELLAAEASLAQAEANLARARANLGAAGDANARLRTARAQVREAELDLEFTRVLAPVTGHVTNLNLRTGSQGVANQPALALVDIDSYWVDAFFRETSVASVRPGDRAVVTLMSYPDSPVPARVDSIGWGIAQDDGSTGQNLLPKISPTFEWIRLAQRIPVRVELGELPEGVDLRVGSTASVLVVTGSAGETGADPAPVAAPRALQ